MGQTKHHLKIIFVRGFLPPYAPQKTEKSSLYDINDTNIDWYS